MDGVGAMKGKVLMYNLLVPNLIVGGIEELDVSCGKAHHHSST